MEQMTKNWKAARLTTCAALAGLLLGGLPETAWAVKIGVLNDQSGPFAHHTGPGSVDAAKMAIEDFGGTLLGKPIELVGADHQNRPDIGLGIARKWLDVENVDVIVDVPNSSVALAVQQLVREKEKIVLFSGAGTSELTGKQCSPNGIQWTYDTYAITNATVAGAVESGQRDWYFITTDFAFGHALERDASAAIVKAGGNVLGAVRHPFNTADFSSFLLSAQNSKANVIGLASAGADTANTIKQAAEFGITDGGKKIAALLVSITEVHGLGLRATRGMLVSEAFYWDMTPETRAWSERFFQRNGRMPTMLHAGVYGAVMHYLNSVKAAGTAATTPVLEKMRATPVNDLMMKNGRIREDGKVMRDFHVFEVKSSQESKRVWDYYKLIRTIPAEKAARPLSESECPLVKK